MSIYEEPNQKDSGAEGFPESTDETKKSFTPSTKEVKDSADDGPGGLALAKGNFARKRALRREAKRQAIEALKHAPAPAVTLRDWYTAFLCMNVPFFGWIYLLALTRSKSHPEIQPFAKAYLLFKLTFFLITLVVLIAAILIGLNMMDQLLAYMDML